MIPKSDIDRYRANYPIISTQLKTGSLHIRTLLDNDPGNGFIPAAPNLEDVYFSNIATRWTSTPSDHSAPSSRLRNFQIHPVKSTRMFFQIFLFEIKYRLRRPAFYVYFSIMLLFTASDLPWAIFL